MPCYRNSSSPDLAPARRTKIVAKLCGPLIQRHRNLDWLALPLWLRLLDHGQPCWIIEGKIFQAVPCSKVRTTNIWAAWATDQAMPSTDVDVIMPIANNL